MKKIHYWRKCPKGHLEPFTKTISCSFLELVAAFKRMAHVDVCYDCKRGYAERDYKYLQTTHMDDPSSPEVDEIRANLEKDIWL